MKNPIFNELIKLKLISKLSLITLSNKTRDKKIKVIKDLKTKITFLEKYITSNEYYSLLKYRDDDRKVSKKSKRKIANVKTFSIIIFNYWCFDISRKCFYICYFFFCFL